MRCLSLTLCFVSLVAWAALAGAEENKPLDLEQVRRWLQSEDQADLGKAAAAIAANRGAAMVLLPELAKAKDGRLVNEYSALLKRLPNQNLMAMLQNSQPTSRKMFSVHVVAVMRELCRRLLLPDEPATDPHPLDRAQVAAAIEELIQQQNRTDLRDPDIYAHAVHSWKSLRKAQEDIHSITMQSLINALGDLRTVTANLKTVGSPQRQAIEILSDCGREAEKPLLVCLKDSDASRRAAAINVLGRRRTFSNEVAETLFQMINDEDVVRAELAHTLTCITDQPDRVTKYLIDSLSDDSLLVQRNAQFSLGIVAPNASTQLKQATVDALVQLCSASDDKGPSAHSLALILPNVSSERAKAAVHQLLPLLDRTDRNYLAVAQAVAAAGENGREAAERIKHLMQSEIVERERLALAQHLWRIERDPEAVLPVFLAGISGASKSNRYYALQGLKAMGKDAHPATLELVKLITGKDPSYSAVGTLEAIGPGAAAAIPFLKPLISSSNESLAKAARSALAVIEGNSGASDE